MWKTLLVPKLPSIIVILILAFTAVTLYKIQSWPSKNETEKSGVAALTPFLAPEPLATPDPFFDLTIPYLRSRTYQSQLGQQKQLRTSSTHTTYLTEYQSDGLKINALLTIPKGEPNQKWPAIVFVHGYIAPTIYKTTERYDDYINYLSRNGFVVLKIDLRGHGDSEGEPGGAYYSSDYIIDTLNAYSALQNAEFVDAQRIGLWGHSMGGNVVMRSLAAKTDIPAIAIWGGAVYTYEDMQQFGIDDNSYRPPSSPSPTRRRREELTETHGAFNANNAFWKLVPATNFLDEITGAVGLFHAVNDDVVSIEYSRGLSRILNKTSIPNELNEYQTGGHNISGNAFNQAMRDTVEFYQKHL